MIPYLTPAELERLSILMEEMGEAIQAIGKIQRHGYESRHPDGGPTNREELEREVGHVRAALAIMTRKNDVSVLATIHHMNDKLWSVQQWLHHHGPGLSEGFPS